MEIGMSKIRMRILAIGVGIASLAVFVIAFGGQPVLKPVDEPNNWNAGNNNNVMYPTSPDSLEGDGSDNVSPVDAGAILVFNPPA
jgi:hypothetical protein